MSTVGLEYSGGATWTYQLSENPEYGVILVGGAGAQNLSESFPTFNDTGMGMWTQDGEYIGFDAVIPDLVVVDNVTVDDEFTARVHNTSRYCGDLTVMASNTMNPVDANCAYTILALPDATAHLDSVADDTLHYTVRALVGASSSNLYAAGSLSRMATESNTNYFFMADLHPLSTSMNGFAAANLVNAAFQGWRVGEPAQPDAHAPFNGTGGPVRADVVLAHASAEGCVGAAEQVVSDAPSGGSEQR